MRLSEYMDWLLDYQKRWPAIAGYIKRNAIDGAMLAETYHFAVSLMDVDVLEEVTRRIMAGTMEPVPNEKLGSFGTEVRRKALVILDERKRGRDRKELLERQDRSPLLDLDMLRQLMIANATFDLIDTEDIDIFTDKRGPIVAAIRLADKPTDAEAAAANETLAKWDLQYEQILERADHLASEHKGVLRSHGD